jgi:pimeloyl-ACP methyl ester carboxylesterase
MAGARGSWASDGPKFFAAYDMLLARWPVEAQPLTIPTTYGSTRVNASGPTSAPPLVLLHGGGSTSTVWFANVGWLAREHRVYAIDQVGDAGRSVNDRSAIHEVDDLMIWLGEVLDGLTVERATLCGHSNGAWLALTYALRDPSRVDRLVLLDPTTCFAGMTVNYRLHAVPLLLSPSGERVRSFMEWEADGRPLDPGWMDVLAYGAGFPTAKLILPRRPTPDQLRGLSVPTSVLVAEQSRTHDAHRVAENARRLVADVATVVVPDATHHTMPLQDLSAWWPA